MSDSQALIEFSQLPIRELSFVIRDDGVRDSEPANDVLPYKTLDLSSCDACKGFRFYPFCKIINCYQQKFPLSSSWREEAYYVHSPQSKRSGRVDALEIVGLKVD